MPIRRNLGDVPGAPAIKAALRRHLVERATGRLVLIEEMGLEHGAAVADLVVYGDYLHGYEIKSDRDSLQRLISQIPIYSRTMARVTLVTGPRQLDAALSWIPAWWGVLTADYQLRLSEHRPSADNPLRSALSIAKLLWRDEALDLLRSRGQRGLSRHPRHVLYLKLAEIFPVGQLERHVVEAMSGRFWKAEVVTPQNSASQGAVHG